MTFKIPKQLFSKPGIIATAAVILLVLAIAWWSSRHAAARLPDRQDTSGAPVAGVAKVTREDLFRQLTIPAEFRPYVEAQLNAKVSGFLKDITVDFGDKVKAGQLLATLEVPELQDELNNALAVEQKAEADYTNANLIYTRLTAVNKDHPNLVAQQDLDTAEANDHSTFAAIGAAKAEVGKYQTLVKYTQITAPFDGVVTWRYADPGALIQAGTSSDSQSLPLVRLSDNYLLRLDFPVSVQYIQYLQVGDSVDVQVDSLGGRKFSGKITRSTGKVDTDTRTMMFEIEVPNPNLELAPGMYATVVLKVENHPDALAVPIQAVNSKDNSILVVNAGDEIESRQVTLGVETPDKYEVISGLKEGELVLVGNPRHLQPGQKVQTIIADGMPGEP
jgi:RND family efflux transporter MFP subunit